MKTLTQIAVKLNQIATNMHHASMVMNNGRVEMGHLLLEVEKRLRKESNMTFGEWCRNNVKKIDGTPFSHCTIKNYMRFARRPDSLAADRKQKKDYASRGRLALQASAMSQSPGRSSIAEQVNRLVSACDHAEDAARKQFLEIVGLDD